MIKTLCAPSQTLTAALSYTPASSQDAEVSLEAPQLFTIPGKLRVIAGAAGQGQVTLTVHTFCDQWDEQNCVYKGGASSDIEDQGASKTLGQRYVLDHCDGSLYAGSTIATNYFKLSVDSGDPTAGPTKVQLPLVNAACKLTAPSAQPDDPFGFAMRAPPAVPASASVKLAGHGLPAPPDPFTPPALAVDANRGRQ